MTAMLHLYTKQDRQALLKAKYCPPVSCRQKRTKNPCNLNIQQASGSCQDTLYLCKIVKKHCKIVHAKFQQAEFMSYRVDKLFHPILQWVKNPKIRPVTFDGDLRSIDLYEKLEFTRSW